MQRLRSLGKHLSAGALAVLLGLVVVASAGAEEDEDRTVRVDLRVWQGVMDPQEVLLSGRPSGGEWRVAPEELPLEQMNKRGTFRYSDHTVGVLVGDGTAYVDVRVWQSVRDPLRLYLSARPSGGKWGATERLLMDDTDSHDYRHGDRAVTVPTPVPPDEDIAALLAWRDTQAGMSDLNWSRSLALSSWTGVTVGGTPQRVTELDLRNRGLRGELSGLVGELTGLTELRLDGNALTGRIPSKVAQLNRLTHVYLAGNALTGCMPPSLPAVANHDLAALGLPDCGAPVDVSYGNPTLTAGTYQVTWAAAAGDSPPLVFDISEGLQLELDGWVLQGPGEVGLVLWEANSESYVALDVYEGGEWNRGMTEFDARLWALYDRVVESAWVDQECLVATLKPHCPVTLRYNRLDATGVAATAGSYAFLKTAGYPASAISSFIRSVSRSLELRVHSADASWH